MPNILTRLVPSDHVMTTLVEPIEGMEWITQFFAMMEIRPRWTVDPDLERIRDVVKAALLLREDVSVHFFAEGSFNKLYSICYGKEEAILRVTLPVDPHWKTLSEVATIGWIGRNTALPVPKILAHDASRDNPIGFEWILMSKLPGKPLDDVWRSIDFEAKKEITYQVAVFCATMFKKQLRGIGNLYSLSKSAVSDGDELAEVKRIVSMSFFWGDRVSRPVPRGPFRSSKEWQSARLFLIEGDSHAIVATCDSEEDVEEARRGLETMGRLQHLINDFFPTREEEDAEPSMLFHDDLHQRNILVDEAGALTGVVDWECVSALPLWKACDFPFFLRGPIRRSKPAMELYAADDISSMEIYWDHVSEYEKTTLREYFLEEMRRLESNWIRVFEGSERLRDFDLALDKLPDKANAIDKWINRIASGDDCKLFKPRI